ncbi:DUF4254 domain-containing protein [Nocardia sp. NPDC050697]|uniref:DUF4254 domain-containing protein n=1 Tax=Nocardia sp. NPDC050697 TaxID=3155158 RepID=UPI00340D8BB6
MPVPSRDPTPPLLPSAEELCSAIRGHHIAPHPVTRFAGELGHLYQQPHARPSECNCRREELALAVDLWASGNLPIPYPDARLHTETLGAVIDHLARTQTHAYHLLMTTDDVSAPHVHAAWYQLAELVDGYTELALALTQRSTRLPAPGEES